jgi:hypothetical protein
MSSNVLRVVLLSTKTSLGTFFDAIRSVEREAGVRIDLSVIYTMDLHRLDPAEVTSRIVDADILLIDARHSLPSYVGLFRS